MPTNLVDHTDQKEAAARYTSTHSQKYRQHTRQRSSSAGAALYSRTNGPATFTPLDNEALSTLISSLTAISNAQKFRANSERPKTRGDRNLGDSVRRVADSSDFQRRFPPAKTLVEDDHQEDDWDFCPPPVAGYNTINAVTPPTRPTTAGADRAQQKAKKKNRLYLKSSKSQTNLAAPSLKSPASAFFHSEPRPSCNESIASLPLSTYSKVNTKSPFRTFFSTRMGSEQNDPEYLSAPRTADADVESRSSMERETDVQRFSAFVRIANIKTDFSNVSPDGDNMSPISPIARNDLSENLIPSRRSSLRGGQRHSSRGSKDLKSLNIDQDLIEENHETVQRIRELQQARERRQNEWKKDARRWDKPNKRSSMPNTNSSPSKKPASGRSSWHSKATDAHDAEEPQDPFSQANATEATRVPSTQSVHHTTRASVDARIDSPVPGLQRQSSVTPSSTQSFSSAKRHRQRLSDSIKRASSIRHSVPDDAKVVSDEVEAFLGSPRLTQKIRHPRTGRTIAFSEVGDPKGSVVLCCVGMGLTRYVTSFYDEIAKAQKLRIITPDRPGVGETDPMPTERSTPLAWVDDVAVICSSLGVERFSLLAHSAGAIYALATALKMPQYIRGRIHLLGPWIPPSQLAIGQRGENRAANLPTSHKILSFLPASFMKAANSRFLSATSASLEPGSRKDRKKDKNVDLSLDADLFKHEASLSRADISQYNNYSMLPTPETTPPNIRSIDQPTQMPHQIPQHLLRSPPVSPPPGLGSLPNVPRLSTLSPSPSAAGARTPNSYRPMSPEARTRLYNTTLTTRTWNLSTLNANPAIDLIICLERRRPIGFRYTDITRHTVIHHGANDTRIPLENVRWLSSAMKRCELRILEGEGHGLMASATVMSEVLAEVGREWDEWAALNLELEKERQREEQIQAEALKNMRRGYPRF